MDCGMVLGPRQVQECLFGRAGSGQVFARVGDHCQIVCSEFTQYLGLTIDRCLDLLSHFCQPLRVPVGEASVPLDQAVSHTHPGRAAKLFSLYAWHFWRRQKSPYSYTNAKFHFTAYRQLLTIARLRRVLFQ